MTYPPWVYRLAESCSHEDYAQFLTTLTTLTGEHTMPAPVSQYTTTANAELIANLRHANLQRNNVLVEEIIERLESALETIDYLSGELGDLQEQQARTRSATRVLLSTLAEHTSGIEGVLNDLTAASLEPVD